MPTDFTPRKAVFCAVFGPYSEELRIVDDQYGRPSSAQDIAGAIARVVAALLGGRTDGFKTFHFANARAATWHVFAMAASLEKVGYRDLRWVADEHEASPRWQQAKVAQPHGAQARRR